MPVVGQPILHCCKNVGGWQQGFFAILHCCKNVVGWQQGFFTVLHCCKNIAGWQLGFFTVLQCCKNVVGSQQGFLSLFIDFSGHQSTHFLLVREEIAVGCPPKSTFN
jgi:hypothetical protein